MIKKFILASAISAVFLSGSVLADNGHGSHTPGTIGAVSNNGTGTTSGGGGRDVLVGGSGDDILVGGTTVHESGRVPTGTVTFHVDGVYLMMTAARMLIL